jgi:hypothetical protein
MWKKKIFRLIPCLAFVEVVVIVVLALYTVRGRAIWWNKSEINCDMRRKKDGLRKRGARFCWLGMTVSPGRSRRWL